MGLAEELRVWGVDHEGSTFDEAAIADGERLLGLVSELEHDCTEARRDLLLSRGELDDERSTVAELREELRAAEHEAGQLRAGLDDSRVVQAALRESLQAASRPDVVALQRERDALQVRAQELVKQLAQLDPDLDAPESDLGKALRELAQARRGLVFDSQDADQLETLADEVDELLGAGVRAQSQRDQAVRRADRLEAQLPALTERITELEEEVDDLSAPDPDRGPGALGDALRAFASGYDESRGEVGDVRKLHRLALDADQLAATAAEVVEAKGEQLALATLERQRDDATLLLARVEHDRDELHDELAEAHRERGETDAQVRMLQVRVREAERARDQARSKVDDLVEEVELDEATTSQRRRERALVEARKAVQQGGSIFGGQGIGESVGGLLQVADWLLATGESWPEDGGPVAAVPVEASDVTAWLQTSARLELLLEPDTDAESGWYSVTGTWLRGAGDGTGQRFTIGLALARLARQPETTGEQDA